MLANNKILPDKRVLTKRSLLDVSKSYLLYFFAVLSITSCIEEFNPEIGDYENLLVIDGSIIKEDSIQVISVFNSKPVGAEEYVPVSGCKISAIDLEGNIFQFIEGPEGMYESIIPEYYLNYGNTFTLQVVTPNGNIYESTPETIFEGGVIDDVYFREETYQSSSVSYDKGLQFYIDLSVPGGKSKNYMWRIEETWEYRSQFKTAAIWYTRQDTILRTGPEIDSIYYCWNTQKVSGLFSSTLEHLSSNEKKGNPLHYVPVISEKLNHKYSILVKQYSLSEPAYEYWNQTRVETTDNGGLYQTQPSQSKSNIRNINDPKEPVLGYFWASSFTQKRIFFSGPLDKYFYEYSCVEDTFNIHFPPREFDTYNLKIIAETPDTVVWGFSSETCFDCNLTNQTNNRPEYWTD